MRSINSISFYRLHVISYVSTIICKYITPPEWNKSKKDRHTTLSYCSLETSLSSSFSLKNNEWYQQKRISFITFVMQFWKGSIREMEVCKIYELKIRRVYLCCFLHNFNEFLLVILFCVILLKLYRWLYAVDLTVIFLSKK